MMNSRAARWTAGVATLCVALLVASWFLLISPRRSEAATLRGEVTNREAMNDQMRMQIAALQKQFANLPQEQAALAAIRLELPEDRAQSPLMRKIEDMAGDTAVTITSYTQGAAAPQGGAVAGAAATKAPNGLALYVIPTAMTVNGDYFSMARFLKRLQTDLVRAYLITSLGLTTSEDGGDGTVTLTLAGQLYVLRDGASAAGIPTPGITPNPGVQAPAASPTPTPTPTPTGSASATASPTATPSPTISPTTTP